MQPLVAPEGAGAVRSARRGVLFFRAAPGHRRWYELKTLWFSKPRYQGPVLVRGRSLNGGLEPRFGETPELVDPLLASGPTTNGSAGWREWPGATWVRASGCYGWQVDGFGFSNTIIFYARINR